MFRTQTEYFFKCHSKTPALILFDCDKMQKFRFSDEVPG